MYKRILLSIVVFISITIIICFSLSKQYSFGDCGTCGEPSEHASSQPETSTSTEGTTTQSGEERRQGAKDSAGANIDYESYPRTLFPTEPPDISTRIKNLATYCLCAGGACGCSKRGDCTEPCAGVTSRPTAPAPVYELACKCGLDECACTEDRSCITKRRMDDADFLFQSFMSAPDGLKKAEKFDRWIQMNKYIDELKKKERCILYDTPLSPATDGSTDTGTGIGIDTDTGTDTGTGTGTGTDTDTDTDTDTGTGTGTGIGIDTGVTIAVPPCRCGVDSCKCTKQFDCDGREEVGDCVDGGAQYGHCLEHGEYEMAGGPFPHYMCSIPTPGEIRCPCGIEACSCPKYDYCRILEFRERAQSVYDEDDPEYEGSQEQIIELEELSRAIKRKEKLCITSDRPQRSIYEDGDEYEWSQERIIELEELSRAIKRKEK